MQVAFRLFDIMPKNFFRQGLKMAKDNFPEVNVRVVVSPTLILDGSIMLRFNQR